MSLFSRLSKYTNPWIPSRTSWLSFTILQFQSQEEAAAQKKVEALEAKLIRKDEVIAELLYERMQLSKATGAR